MSMFATNVAASKVRNGAEVQTVLKRMYMTIGLS